MGYVELKELIQHVIRQDTFYEYLLGGGEDISNNKDYIPTDIEMRLNE